MKLDLVTLRPVLQSSTGRLHIRMDAAVNPNVVCRAD